MDHLALRSPVKPTDVSLTLQSAVSGLLLSVWLSSHSGHVEPVTRDELRNLPVPQFPPMHKVGEGDSPWSRSEVLL